MTVTARDAEEATKAMMLKDLRIECRARGVSPAGSREDLLARVRENMVETGDCTIISAAGAVGGAATVDAPPAAAAAPAGRLPPRPSANDESSGPTGTAKNNYARPSGQNVGNFLGDRRSSRVLAPPGGVSSIQLG